MGSINLAQALMIQKGQAGDNSKPEFDAKDTATVTYESECKPGKVFMSGVDNIIT
jgi:hypothetical protein